MMTGVADPPLFFFGAQSPYSWFAAERIGAVLPAAVWRPVFAGGLFKGCGRVSWGLTDERPAKIADCTATAAALGLPTIAWPDPWPTSDVLVARAMLHAERRGLLQPFALAAMRTAFVSGRDLGELSAVQEAGEQVGIAPAELAAAVEDPEIRAGLRAATQDALDRGVTGLPSIVVDDTVYWGADRLDEAAAHARSRSG